MAPGPSWYFLIAGFTGTREQAMDTKVLCDVYRQSAPLACNHRLRVLLLVCNFISCAVIIVHFHPFHTSRAESSWRTCSGLVSPTQLYLVSVLGA